MDIFDLVDNDKFFNPLSSRNRRIYYECIVALIEKSMENYMSYEIVINNADVKDGKFSKQAGYNSGAGTQIPYTLILSAALSMLYNARVNSGKIA